MPLLSLRRGQGRTYLRAPPLVPQVDWIDPAPLVGLRPGELRGMGQTTLQMQKAPQGAHYVWPDKDLSYPKALAHHLGRDDLVIHDDDWLETPAAFKHREPVVLDHEYVRRYV